MQGPETYRVNYAGQSLFQIGFTYQPHLQILFGTRAINISIRARIIREAEADIGIKVS
jgi:hypothetical protein